MAVERKLKYTLKRYLGEEIYSVLRSKYFGYKREAKSFFRLATYFLRPIPDFIIPGAMKSGTTSLYSYLSQQYEVNTSFDKEVHFFDHNYDKGSSWYRSKFPVSAKTNQDIITGEASPYYLFHPTAPERIKEVAPNIKMIILLRNPVQRAISHYWHNFRAGIEKIPMLEAFKKEEDRINGEEEKIIRKENYYSYNHVKFSYLRRGKYHFQLDRYYDNFCESQIILVKSESLFEESNKCVERVCDFLDIDFRELSIYEKNNQGDYFKEASVKTKSWLRDYFKSPNKKLNEKYGVNFQ